jgi:salicylate hydroxylase
VDYDAFLRREFPAPDSLPREQLRCGGVPAIRSGALHAPATAPVVLHLHGGGYVLGSAEASLELADRLAAATGGWTLTPDYRLAPEHPFPAALDDVIAVYQWLTTTAPESPILLFGECAGGGLALALAIHLRRTGQRRPAAIHLVSPFVDLSVRDASFNPETRQDPWLNRIMLTQFAAAYVQDADLAAPLLSPIDADLRGLPPLALSAARDEALFPSVETLAARAEAAGVQLEFHPVADSVHSFVLFPYLPEASAAVARLATFARQPTPTVRR